MDKSACVERWNHTSQILCKIHNVHCTDAKYLKEPWQFHRYWYEYKPARKKGSIECLKIFVRNKNKGA